MRISEYEMDMLGGLKSTVAFCTMFFYVSKLPPVFITWHYPTCLVYSANTYCTKQTQILSYSILWWDHRERDIPDLSRQHLMTKDFNSNSKTHTAYRHTQLTLLLHSYTYQTKKKTKNIDINVN